MSKKKKIIIVIVVIVLFVLIGIGCFAMMRYIDELKQKDYSAGLKTQSNIFLDEDSEDNRELVSSINVNIRRSIVITKNENGKYSMVLDLHNGNEHQYVFTISVDEKNIYSSDLIPAGASLYEVELDDIDLETGIYDAVVIFTVVSEKDNETVMGSTGVQVGLDVTK